MTKAVYRVWWKSEDGWDESEIIVATEEEAKELIEKYNRPWVNDYNITINTANYEEIKLYEVKTKMVY